MNDNNELIEALLKTNTLLAMLQFNSDNLDQEVMINVIQEHLDRNRKAIKNAKK